MIIHGLQKMTLLDFPGRVACTVFLGGCDFRCPFCHNYELVEGEMPAAKLGTKTIRVNRKALEEYLQRAAMDAAIAVA